MQIILKMNILFVLFFPGLIASAAHCKTKEILVSPNNDSVIIKINGKSTTAVSTTNHERFFDGWIDQKIPYRK